MRVILRSFFVILYCLALSGMVRSQQPPDLDSMKRELAKVVDPEGKLHLFDLLARTTMNLNPRASDSLGQAMIRFAEETRNRKLMVKAYMHNGLRCSYFKGQKEYNKRSIDYYLKALAIARQNSMENLTVGCLLQLADVHLAIPDKDLALKYVAEAFSRTASASNDSLLVEANNIYGKVYLARNDKILALRHYLTALRMAEDLKPASPDEKRMKSELLRNCYLYLTAFYTNIEDFDKAIDYNTQALKMLDNLTDKKVAYSRVIDINAIGNLFAAKKNYEIAINYFEKSIRLADSLKYNSLKMPGYVSMLNQYLRMDQPRKALEFLNSARGQGLKQYLLNFGMTGVLDQSYGYIHTELNNIDSARPYMMKALSFFENKINEGSAIGFYLQLARFYDKAGETDKAIKYYLIAKEAGERNGMLETAITASKHLDSMYTRKGDFRTASAYNGIYYKYRDSSEKLNKEKELAQVQAADEQQQLIKKQKEEEEARRRKNNIQYMAIIIGIILLFVILVVLGMFKVSATVIKAIGFFVFLLFFEFIFLVFKKNIYSITHGEPWKDLAFMIALAALLVPLHHWLEHKVLHYLTSHNRLTQAGNRIRKKFFKKSEG